MAKVKVVKLKRKNRKTTRGKLTRQRKKKK